MKPAPDAPFDVPDWIDKAKVHPDHHIQVAHALYSVPTRYLRRHVRVRADRSTVRSTSAPRIIKVHPRKPPGGRSTDVHDYPAEKAAYALRDVDAILRKARDKGHHVGLYAERLLGGPLPWTRMRQAYALLGLCDKYTPGRVEAICQSALAFDLVSVPRIARKLKAAAKPVMPCAAMGKVVQLRSRASLAPRSTSRRVGPPARGGRLMATKTPCSTRSRLRAQAPASRPHQESLPERLVLADKQDVAFDELLLMLLTDGSRRDNTAADNRAHDARPDPPMPLEQWDQTSKASFDKRMLSEPVSLRFLDPHRHVCILGPVGVGKTFVASALGHVACRHGYNVRFARADATLQKVATEPLRQLPRR
ncbi:MAG: ATP-binding protein [Polyangiaceae bacterium]|nr:ATP-binding protein [Polyangiaceae bacterium]